jgi:site-specific recombinase XerD
MTDTALLGPWLRRFLLEHLVNERNLSRNTRLSYRDTLVLLIGFLTRKLHQSPEKLMLLDVSPDLVQAFLLDLEESRHCSIPTRNQRLAAIRSLARFIGMHSPEHIVWCGQMRCIPMKKTTHRLLSYLEKPEMEALLEAPDAKTAQGRRDRTLLWFLYNSGTRADEAAQLTIADLQLAHPPQRGQSWVNVMGKGRKIRPCPLWPKTAAELSLLIEGRALAEHVFLNRRSQPLTRFGIHALVKRYVRRAATKMPSLAGKRISPHTIRHTAATHLLRSGVDINTIRGWLGHVSVDTTHIYAESDLEAKAKALAQCEIPGPKPTKPWKEDASLMAFLRGL